jgi:hypothetical protein
MSLAVAKRDEFLDELEVVD